MSGYRELQKEFDEAVVGQLEQFPNWYEGQDDLQDAFNSYIIVPAAERTFPRDRIFSDEELLDLFADMNKNSNSPISEIEVQTGREKVLSTIRELVAWVIELEAHDAWIEKLRIAEGSQATYAADNDRQGFGR